MFKNLNNFLGTGYFGEMRATIDAMNNQDCFRQGFDLVMNFLNASAPDCDELVVAIDAVRISEWILKSSLSINWLSFTSWNYQLLRVKWCGPIRCTDYQSLKSWNVVIVECDELWIKSFQIAIKPDILILKISSHPPLNWMRFFLILCLIFLLFFVIAIWPLTTHFSLSPWSLFFLILHMMNIFDLNNVFVLN